MSTHVSYPLSSFKVTVHARENETTSETCTWDVVFETNTGLEGDGGELPLITAAFYNITNSSYSDLDTTVTQVPTPPLGCGKIFALYIALP